MNRRPPSAAVLPAPIGSTDGSRWLGSYATPGPENAPAATPHPDGTCELASQGKMSDRLEPPPAQNPRAGSPRPSPPAAFRSVDGKARVALRQSGRRPPTRTPPPGPPFSAYLARSSRPDSQETDRAQPRELLSRRSRTGARRNSRSRGVTRVVPRGLTRSLGLSPLARRHPARHATSQCVCRTIAARAASPVAGWEARDIYGDYRRSRGVTVAAFAQDVAQTGLSPLARRHLRG